MKSVRLEEIVDICSSKRIKMSEYVTSGIPFYRSKEIINLHKNQNIQTELFITEERFEEINSKSGSPIEGDILLTSVGTLGVPYQVKKDDKFYFKDGNLTWLRNFSNDVNQRYFYFWLTSPIAKRKFDEITIGSTQKALTIVSLKGIEIDIPSISEQNKIAEVIGEIQEKIELNQKMNETLEEIAKTLFKSWFIDFDPIRAKAKGRPTGLSKEISDLFPDSFEDSELGEIPKGWRCSSISSKYDFLSGFAFKSKDWIEEGVPVVKIKSIDSGIVDLDTDTFVSEDFLGTKSSYILNEGDILIAMTGATIGKVGVVPISTKKSLLNQRVGKFIHRDNSKNFFLNCFVSSRLFLKNIENLATGSARDNISKDQILSIKTIIPTDDIYNKFGELTEDIRKKILIANNENNILEKLRDALLPKLISGELQIPDAENLVEEAGI